jgi:peptidyl-dipeptidase Dcp
MSNPFFEDWAGPFGAPSLDRIRPEHFAPAYDRALAEHAAEVAAIAADPAPPGFDNVIVALEASGRLLTRVDGVFHNLAASVTDAALQAIELEMAPRLAAHWSAITLNSALFARIDALHRRRDTLGLDEESLRVLERYHLDFVRAGARLTGTGRARFAEISARLAVLGTQFSQNVLGDEEDYVLGLSEAQMAGVPPSIRDAAAACAQERGVRAPFAVTLSRSSVEPMLQFADDRALRETLFGAWTGRGMGRHDNRPIVAEMLALRTEQAGLLGYENFAAFKLADSMAGTPDKARALLDEVWKPARARALEERAALQALIAREGGNFQLAPWDWRYYAEKLRREQFDFDEAAIKPYLELNTMIAAAFFTAGKLFGLSFKPRGDIAVHHPDVRVWEVTRGGQAVGLFLGDYFARPGKQGGAWMSSFRDQQALNGEAVLPIVINNCNFSKSDPCLLSFDDAVTLFHEFGHALHGLLSQVRFPRLSGTNVARDFVELPSQLFEHWLEQPQVLTRFARHYRSGQAMPAALMDRLLKTRNFGQGFATVEFLASAIVDMDLHSRPPGSAVLADPLAAQAQSLRRIAMPDAIVPRHGAAHFTHVFGGDGYAAGYYAYLWAEVLDADGFGAFEEAKDPFDPAAARRLYRFIYSGGGTRDYSAAYRAFRGRDPRVDALLEGRGLKPQAA